MRKVFAVLAALLTLVVVLQFYFAAVGVFSEPADELFIIHGENGRIVIRSLALLTLIAAAIARAGRRTIWLSALTLGLVLFQTVLFILVGVIFGIGPENLDVIPVGATIMLGFHAINGVAILAVSAAVARRAWALGFGSRRRVDATLPADESLPRDTLSPGTLSRGSAGQTPEQ